MPFITNHNAEEILRSMDLSSLDHNLVEFHRDKLYMLTKKEKQRLLAFKNMLNKSKEFAECYVPLLKKKDDYRYLRFSNVACYHNDPKCKNLNSEFENIEIPEQVFEKGKEEVKVFRKWMKVNEELHFEDPDRYRNELKERFGVTDPLRVVRIKNSGFVEMTNKSFHEIEKELDEVLEKSREFYFQNKTILAKYSKMAYLAKKEEKLDKSFTDEQDREAKDIIIEYDECYRSRIYNLLRDYYRMKYNPGLVFDKKLLDQLGFKPCKECCNKEIDPLEAMGYVYEDF